MSAIQPELYDRLRKVAPIFQGFSLEQIIDSVQKLVRDQKALTVGEDLGNYKKLEDELVNYTKSFRRTKDWASVDRNDFGAWVYRVLDYADSLKTEATDPEKVKKLKITIFKAYIERFDSMLSYGSRKQIKPADHHLYDEASRELVMTNPRFKQIYGTMNSQQPL